MLEKLKGARTFIFFLALSLLGVVTLIEADKIEAVLLPLLCQMPAMPEVPTECTEKVVKLTGGIMLVVGIIGKVLRVITTSPLFKSE